MYLVKTPKIIQTLRPAFLWRMPPEEKVLYLTFDDGPIPEVTPWVLDLLDRYSATATFFCVGDNVRKHHDIYQMILQAGHATGNHTFHHLNGWNTEHRAYFRDIRRCAEVVHSSLFRPPYGRILPRQRAYLERRYQIVMWDVLSGDFDTSLSPEDCLRNVLDHVEPGSIVVFHDSLKAEPRLRYVLPRVLEYFKERGWRFERIGR
ncbi:MAG: polysaccharide deacetylase family protein [Saprospiraceae bacterium]|nr:polysaccharide deacetylase family protein [Saprospiraceae bacterium]HNL38184.1 polysaccharide deacetylase family protein [Saprospiraceae bacterium]